jgi:hypothetical protein
MRQQHVIAIQQNTVNPGTPTIPLTRLDRLSVTFDHACSLVGQLP